MWRSACEHTATSSANWAGKPSARTRSSVTRSAAILKALEIPPERDFATFEYLGNIGTVSLPITAAIADERGFLEPGDRVGLLGISSGLNCLMLGVNW